MNKESLDKKLEEVFRENFDDEDLCISDEMEASDIEEWDSLSHITLIVATEEAFGVRFSPSEIEKLNNIGEFKKLIMSKL